MARPAGALALLVMTLAAPAHASPLTLDTSRPGSALAVADSRNAAAGGDVNGDGITDLLVPGRDTCPSLTASFRRGDGWTPAGGFAIADSRGGCPGLYPPYGDAGDVNGDGLGDVLVRSTRPGSRQLSALYVVFGKPDGDAIDLARLGTRGFRISDSSQASGAPSTAITYAHGDFDGDGRADLLFQSKRSSSSARIVLGRATGDADLDALGEGGVNVDAPAAVERFTFAGDMNADGRAELVASIAGDPAKEANAGTWVVFGRPGSAAVKPALDPAEFRIDVVAAAAGVGDVNGDGRADIALGTFGPYLVVFGKPDTAAVTTANRAPFAGFRVREPLSPCGPYAEDPPAAAGDVNADGLADVVFGCTVVLGKTDGAQVDAATPGRSSFNVAPRYEPQGAVIGVGDVTGDGRGDLYGVGEGARLLIPSPAAVASADPLAVTPGGTDAVAVLCLAHAGCTGAIELAAAADTGCASDTLRKGEVAGRAELAAQTGELVRVRVPLAPAALSLTRCLLGLAVAQRVSAGGTPASNETLVELMPSPVPAGTPWTVRTRAVLGQIGAGDLTAGVDAFGDLFGVYGARRGGAYGFHSLGERAGAADAVPGASIGMLTRARVVVGGYRRSGKHQIAVYALGRPGGRVGRTRDIDPGHVSEGATDVAGNGRGTALALFPRRISRRGSTRLVARFLTSAGPGRASPLLSHSVAAFGGRTAINGRSDGIAAWCSDPDVALVAARRGRFGRVQKLADNGEGACGWDAAAAGPNGRFAYAWSSWVSPYNDDGGVYPTEIKVAVGTAGGRFRVIAVDESGDDDTQNAPVTVAFRGTHPLVGFTAYDPLTATLRAVVQDVLTGTRRNLSPPQRDALFGTLAVRRDGALAASWTTFDPNTGLARGAYANFARRGLGFGAPERLEADAARLRVEGPPGVAFTRSGKARAMWFHRRGAARWRVAFAKRP